MNGVYILLISVTESISVRIAALGNVSFKKGLYVYVGSAQNSLEKRVERHFRRVKKKFWHVDYLLGASQTEILEVFYKKVGRLEECRIAERLSKIATPIWGFGSSDCKCKGHLFRIEAYDILSGFTREVNMKTIGRTVPIAKTGWCVWITGLPGSGKSTVSETLLKLLEKKGIHAQLLSSDALRKVLTSKPSYSLEERDAVYSALVYLAELLTRNGVNVIIDATGNLKRYRKNARKKIQAFIEVYLECPLKACKQREAGRWKTHNAPKQIYEKAQRGNATTVPGVGQPYEASSNPELTLDTTRCSPMECAQKVLAKILQAETGGKSRA